MGYTDFSNNVLKRGYFPCRFYNIWNNFKHFFKTIKWSYQRITKGFCESDLWNLDESFRVTMIAALKEFKHTTHSYPPQFDDIHEWYSVLDEMIMHLKAMDRNIYCNAYSDEIRKITSTEMKNEISIKYREENKRIEETIKYHTSKFMKLFEHYLRDLWD